MAKNDLRNDAAGNGDQYVVGAHLYPMLTTGWSAQAVAAPIIDDIVVIAVFAGNPLTAIDVMVSAGASSAAVVVVSGAPVVVTHSLDRKSVV